ncbi:TetR/AcrR family transcriptional regulator [Inquilinus sp. Marseille-Q2685]|uniref:TetR/AcrR family transcriptional regulator n=1 Tax=Inquilinus sp. Marseille-Q2685 TaxID=2866581 RepID=UPI001CE430B7|nr:TetR/AcrR family transcriptional regulator [Inquilinus sp. Marseille-Q2685]
MARPLSEEKRDAILAAAAELIAALGLGASTAKIAKAAGVAEGTLFTYFPTKDDLLNQLFLEIETDLAAAVLAAGPAGSDPRDRVRQLWDRMIDWGLANPVRRKALRQLKVSGRIRADILRRFDVQFREARAVVEQSLAGHCDPARMPFYIDTVLLGLAEIVMDAITANPKDQEPIRQAGFDLFWKGTAA